MSMSRTTMSTRYEIVQKYAEQYKKVTKKKKGSILDTVCDTTGLSRDRAARLLAAGGYQKTRIRSAKPIRAETRGRKPKCGAGDLKALVELWKYSDYACGKKLAAAIPAIMGALLRFGEVSWSEDVQKVLLEISASTIDRVLKPEKKRMGFKGLSTTRAGSMLKSQIPVRLGTEWADAKPGYVEVDLVAHCGNTTAGEYVNTLDVTDVTTTWTETRAVINKAQKHVFQALIWIRFFLPFDLRGLDSDNGSEFINAHLLRYCMKEELVFTRSRPYKKNDGCHVEQKNNTVVRRHIGYERYEGQEAVDLLNEFYALLRLHSNFFQPQTKLISSERVDSHVKKTYEEYKSPYERVLASPDVPEEKKAELREVFETLNPAELMRGMADVLQKLQAIAIPYQQAGGR